MPYAWEAKALQTIVPSISAELKSGFDIWILQAEAIAGMAACIVAGNCGEKVGRLPAILASLAINAMGTVCSATASEIGSMIVGRVLQGASGAALLTLANIVISDLVPRKRRTNYMGMLALTFALFAFIGSPLAGSIAEKLSWRWFFWVQCVALLFWGRASEDSRLPVLLLSGVMAYCGLRRQKMPSASWRDALRSVDWLGHSLIVTSCTLLGLALTLHASEEQIRLAGCLFGLAGVLFAAWLLVERRLKGPSLPWKALSDRTCFSSCFCVFLTFLSGDVLIDATPLFWQAQDLTPSQSGIRQLVFAVPLAIALIIAMFYITYRQAYRSTQLLAWTFNTIGLILLSTLRLHEPVWRWAIPFALAGIGQGPLWECHVPSALAAVPESSSGQVLTFIALLTNGAFVIGQGVGNAFLQKRLRLTLPDAAVRLLERHNDYGWRLPKILHSLEADDNAASQVAMNRALSTLYLASAVISCIGLISALCIRELPMHAATDPRWAIEGDQSGSTEDDES